MIFPAPPLIGLSPLGPPPVNRAAAASSSMRGNRRRLRPHVRQHRLAPSAAERDNEIDRRRLDLRLSGQKSFFGRQLLGFRHNDRSEGLSAGLIFVERDLRRLAGNSHVFGLHFDLAREDANPRKRILHLLDRIEPAAR